MRFFTCMHNIKLAHARVFSMHTHAAARHSYNLLKGYKNEFDKNTWGLLDLRVLSVCVSTYVCEIIYSLTLVHYHCIHVLLQVISIVCM